MEYRHSWEEITERLSRALSYSAKETTIDVVMEGIQNQRWVLWELEDPDILVVTQIQKLHEGFRVHIFLAEGIFSEKNLRKIEDYARRIGAVGVQWTGRRGWARKVKPFGYNEQYVTMIRDFENE